MKRLFLQMLVIVVAALVTGFVSNAARNKLAWGGNDPELLKRQADISRISLDEAAKHTDDAHAFFLDVRPRVEFDASRIRGAVSFSADDFTAAYAEIRDFLGPDVQVIVYGESTLPAVRAAEFLQARGHTAVRVLDGGWRMWQERTLPVDTGAAP